ncbi:MAG: tRNA lysidine(34) synthetase TilS [Gammaproteobacteria bacterium]|nr:tRNA lysidine(34) synthetase TilS [Gammaproteobacteria bacterium]
MLSRYAEYFSKAARIIIAYSGGVDSHVLLQACSDFFQHEDRKKLYAVHIHHGLMPDADHWSSHCEQICKTLKIPFKMIRVNVPKIKGESLEATARTQRYLSFSKLMKKNDVLLTAHHQDDQAETCLLQFLRGAGIKGLSAMPSIIPFSEGYLIRPLLDTSRKEILSYAKACYLDWVEDQSNVDTRFTRNFLRHQVIPLLNSRWPNIGKAINRVAHHCSETTLLIAELAKLDLNNAQGTQTNTLSCAKLLKLSFERQKNALRHWLHQQKIPLPSAAKLSHILTDVIQARPDRNPIVSWANFEARKYQNNLYVIEKRKPFDSKQTFSWNMKKDLTLPDVGILHVEPTVGQELKSSSKNVTVKFRTGGEKCRLPNQKIHRPLKKLLQEWKVPPWERDRIPLIFIDHELAMVVGYCICEGFQAKREEKGIAVGLIPLK